MSAINPPPGSEPKNSTYFNGCYESVENVTSFLSTQIQHITSSAFSLLQDFFSYFCSCFNSNKNTENDLTGRVSTTLPQEDNSEAPPTIPTGNSNSESNASLQPIGPLILDTSASLLETDEEALDKTVVKNNRISPLQSPNNTTLEQSDFFNSTNIAKAPTVAILRDSPTNVGEKSLNNTQSSLPGTPTKKLFNESVLPNSETRQKTPTDAIDLLNDPDTSANSTLVPTGLIKEDASQMITGIVDSSNVSTSIEESNSLEESQD